MNRPFLFLAGEWSVSQPLVFSRDHWSHAMTLQPFAWNDDSTFRRAKVFSERLQGVIFYASVANESIRREALAFLAENNVPCWPNPRRLLELDDRFAVLKECVEAGFVSHPVVFSSWADREGIEMTLDLPYVLKVGNLHQGEGKHLIHGDGIVRVPEWQGVASAEPYFMNGISARALFIGDQEFSFRFDNPGSWVKNSAGAEVAPWSEAPKEMMDHARKVHEYFRLEISGIDYVVDQKTGEPHFLEFNQFPGVNTSDETAAAARKLFTSAMDNVERLALVENGLR